jgi:hypothetical protein
MKKLGMIAVMVAGLAGITGYATAQDYRYSDRDDNGRYDNRYDNDNRYDSFREGQHAAREFGYRDGAQVAREDARAGKRFNPKPRGRFDDRDHGYRREFGDKRQYRDEYSEAYRAGYQREFGERGYYR